jgi:hypothetical protein
MGNARARGLEPDVGHRAPEQLAILAMSMARCEAPIISTLNFSSTPSRTRSSAVLSAVWPPMVGRSALGRSFSMMRAIVRQLIGSMYIESALSGSVMMVAGLEFTRMTR